MSGVAAPTDPLPIAPLSGPIDAVVRVPGSKSLSNRHLVLAALATAPVRLRGLLAGHELLAKRGDLRKDAEIECHVRSLRARITEVLAAQVT